MPSSGFNRWVSTQSLLLAGLFALNLPAWAGGPDYLFGDGFELPVTVEQVQLGLVSGNVLLAGRVVTARSADGKNLWIADAVVAAQYQGVYVFRGSGAAPLPADIVPGARVDVGGLVTEFDSAPPGDTLTQIVAGDVLFLLPPQAQLVPIDFASVSALASIVDGEPYEGVVVRATNVRVLTVGPGSRVTVVDNTGGQLVLANNAGGLGTLPTVGTCYASVTGVMHLNVVDDQRVLLPRAASDLVTGSGCT